jgi:hypothetical protein
MQEPKKIRITKKEWISLGGLENPKLSRKQVSNKWQYFKSV